MPLPVKSVTTWGAQAETRRNAGRAPRNRALLGPPTQESALAKTMMAKRVADRVVVVAVEVEVEVGAEKQLPQPQPPAQQLRLYQVHIFHR